MLQAIEKVAGDVKPELSIVMPCLNEARTVGICVEKALSYLEDTPFPGQLITNFGYPADRNGAGQTVASIESPVTLHRIEVTSWHSPETGK